MLRSFLALAFMFGIVTTVQAEVTAKQITEACTSLDNATPKRCACMGDIFVENLKEPDRLYAYAMLRVDETLLMSIKGSFSDEKSKKVQQKMIPMMLYCMKK